MHILLKSKHSTNYYEDCQIYENIKMCTEDQTLFIENKLTNEIEIFTILKRSATSTAYSH